MEEIFFIKLGEAGLPAPYLSVDFVTMTGVIDQINFQH